MFSGAAEVALPEVVGTSMTEDATFSFLESNARLSEVTMKIMAAPTVILLRNVPGPRLPNTVWLDPPNAAPIRHPSRPEAGSRQSSENRR